MVYTECKNIKKGDLIIIKDHMCYVTERRRINISMCRSKLIFTGLDLLTSEVYEDKFDPLKKVQGRILKKYLLIRIDDDQMTLLRNWKGKGEYKSRDKESSDILLIDLPEGQLGKNIMDEYEGNSDLIEISVYYVKDQVYRVFFAKS